jgi:hypothetical protein
LRRIEDATADLGRRFSVRQGYDFDDPLDTELFSVWPPRFDDAVREQNHHVAVSQVALAAAGGEFDAFGRANPGSLAPDLLALS